MTAGFAQPEDGEYRRVVTTGIYSRQALVVAQAAFRQHCKVAIQPSGENQAMVAVTPIGEAAADADQALLEFWTFARDTEAQRRLEA
jgi:hypothetical protein